MKLAAVLHDLIAELDRNYSGAIPCSQSINAGTADGGAGTPERQPQRERRRRMRRSALDPIRPLIEAFVVRRARAVDPTRFTYGRLATLIRRRSGRQFSETTIRRRLVAWGLDAGMRRYAK
jgi:hypothetical protein